MNRLERVAYELGMELGRSFGWVCVSISEWHQAIIVQDREGNVIYMTNW